MPDATPLDLDALEAVARAATPGPWTADGWTATGETDGFGFVTAPGHCGRDECPCTTTIATIHLSPADMEFIAAAQPTTVLALIDQLRTQSVEIAYLKATLDETKAERDHWMGYRVEAQAQKERADALAAERDSARDDADQRWLQSDHKAAKFYRRARTAESQRDCLAATLQRVRDLHQPKTYGPPVHDEPACSCGSLEVFTAEDGNPAMRSALYPCATIRAIDGGAR